jgi:hypothetical protein
VTTRRYIPEDSKLHTRCRENWNLTTEISHVNGCGLVRPTPLPSSVTLARLPSRSQSLPLDRRSASSHIIRSIHRSCIPIYLGWCRHFYTCVLDDTSHKLCVIAQSTWAVLFHSFFSSCLCIAYNAWNPKETRHNKQRGKRWSRIVSRRLFLYRNVGRYVLTASLNTLSGTPRLPSALRRAPTVRLPSFHSSPPPRKWVCNHLTSLTHNLPKKTK